ncbi:KdsC family phosphatase [Prochlorococcus marinus]|uniref:KdsC family phosphatase n=1 Tax=Prochlorococcus marinus TaxID=1219 RepID=UPI0022B45164|nr:HAD hydrolase family protein [Prochlorococcus marinus]
MTNPFMGIVSDIKLIAMDFDGVLSDGGIYIDSKGNEMKRFDVKDGMGIKLLQANGFHIALISGSKSNTIHERANSLKIDIVLKGVENKLFAINKVQKELNIIPQQTIFLGDDVNDLLVLPAVKMFLTPANAHPACIKNAYWTGSLKGGEGFIREFTDLFLLALNINPLLPFETCNN